MTAIALPNATGQTIDLQALLTQRSRRDYLLYFELPLAATYVINTDGTLVHAFVEADYTKREEPEKVVNVLKQLPVRA